MTEALQESTHLTLASIEFNPSEPKIPLLAARCPACISKTQRGDRFLARVCVCGHNLRLAPGSAGCEGRSDDGGFCACTRKAVRS